jgi:hypothetical protein
MSQHTAGPWSVGETRHKYDLIIRNSENDPVASVFLAGYGPQTGAANARLIAAAPEMLAALKAAQEILERNGIVRSEVEAAIAKAEGR